MKISVIMPVYNAEEYLRDSINSFLDQTIQDIELICIDDGSTDSSREILSAYNDLESKKIVVLTQENCGSGKARNKGIEAANGEFLYFLDADDLIPRKTTLDTLYSKAKETNAKIVGGSVAFFLGSREIEYDPETPSYFGQRFDSEGMIKYSDYQYDFGFQRFLYNRDLILTNALLFPDYLRYQDPPFFVKTMFAADSFYAIPECTYKYRTSEVPVSWNKRKIRDMIDGISEVAVFAKQNKLSTLEELSDLRLSEDCWAQIWYMISTQMDVELIDILFNRFYAINFSNCEIDLGLSSDNSPAIRRMLLDIEGALKDLVATKEENDILKDDVRVLSNRISELNNKLVALNNTYNSLEERHASTLSSNSWKIGRLITWLPRKIKSLLHTGINSSK